jgi:hypothetical protein
MFDYQAGEKYKLTLIMVGLSGMMAGIFFTLLLMPTPEPQRVGRVRHHAAWMEDPDVTGRARMSGAEGNSQIAPRDANALHEAAAQREAATQPVQTQAPPADRADPNTALSLVQEWLNYAWDLSAGSAKTSQATAMAYMTPECAGAYRQNVFTPEIAQRIEQSGVKSSFRMDSIYVGTNNPDGTVVVFVQGEQVLSVPGKGSKTRYVNLEYMVKKTTSGLKISGISEGGHKS